MFLNSVVLILQEILEAALLISVLLVLVRSDDKGRSPGYGWLAVSLLAGLAGSWLYASSAPGISGWFDYVGLEVIGSSMHIVIVLCLLILCYGKFTNLHSAQTFTLMVIVIALSIVREVSEIILYVNGILGQPGNISPVFWGGLTGAGLGISSGIVLYYSMLIFFPVKASRIAMVLLAFFAGNMISQAVLLLTQADWLPYTPQLWDTSGLIAEYSVTGQLLYALIGYEANPSLLQAVLYLLAWLLVVLSPLFRSRWSAEAEQGVSRL